MSDRERILILDLLTILQKYSDAGFLNQEDAAEKYSLSQAKIIEILEGEKYGYEAPVNRRTVKNNLEKLIKYSEGDDANEILYTKTERVQKGRGITEDGKKAADKVFQVLSNFCYVHSFTHGQLRLIIDSILFSKQIPTSQRIEIIKKLEGLSSKYFDSRMSRIGTLDNEGPVNHRLFDNIEVLDEAIQSKRQVTFKYNHYQVDEDRNLLLLPRLNKAGQPREYLINPYYMAAANGRYYLICNYDYFNTISHYRLDRIQDIKIIDKPQKPLRKLPKYRNGIDLADYMREHLYMFTGGSVYTQIRFEKRVLSEFIDWFGTEEIDFSDLTDDKLTVGVKVNEEAMRKWALQYGLHVQVLSPPSLVKKIKADIEHLWKKYE